MKTLCRGLLAVMAVVLIVNAAEAGPIKTEIGLTALQYVGSTDTVSQGDLYGSFALPATTNEFGYFLSVYFRDTVASAAAADTLIFRLVRRPDGAGDLDTCFSSAIASNPSGYITVYSTAVTGAQAANFPITKHIPLDSLRVYPIGPGTYSWLVLGGRTTAAHRMDKAYKFDAFIEHEGAY